MPPNYSSLPAELRLQILQELADAHTVHRSRRRGIAAYASVCRDWQLFFEPLTFKHLVVAYEDLDDFCRFTQDRRRRRLVKHTWLRYRDLLAGGGPRRVTRPREEGSVKNSFELGIMELWETLAGWDVDEVDPEGLTLEISSFAVIGPDNKPLAPWDDLGAYSKYLESGSVKDYGEKDRFYLSEAQQTRIESVSNVKKQVFCKGTMYRTKQLPEVHVVTRLLTRRAFTRNLRPQAWSVMLKSLPRLRELRMERWRLGLVKTEDDWLLDMEETFQSSVPPSLKMLSFFEEKGVRNPRFRLIPKDKLIQDIIQATLHLEKLSICFFIEADDLLQALHFREANPEDPERPPKGYGELTSLTLTSTRFKAEMDENWNLALWVKSVSQLLLRAAVAALGMPKLRLMEIWNSGRGTAAIFRYEVKENGVAEISWQSTQYCDPFEKDVLQSWRKVAAEHGRQGLEACSPVLLHGDFEYYGSTIPLLRSKDLVIQAVSAAQMR